jgi:hypothetical protein
MKKLALILLLSLFGKIAGAKAGNDPLYLEISARLFNLDHQNHHYGIELIQDDKVRDTVSINGKGSFSFLVQKNKQYMIRITENNKIVSETIIYSRNPEKDQNEGNFTFHEAVMKEGMPQAMISFRSSLRNYTPRKESAHDHNKLLVMAD